MKNLKKITALKPKKIFRIMFATACVVGGLSVIIYTFTKGEVFLTITATSAIIGGVSAIGLGLSCFKQ